MGSQRKVVSTRELGQGRDHSRAVLCALGWARGREIQDTWDWQNVVINCLGVGAKVGLGDTPEGGSMRPQSPAARCWVEPLARGSSLGRGAGRPGGGSGREVGGGAWRWARPTSGLTAGSRDCGMDGRTDCWRKTEVRCFCTEPVGSPHQVREHEAWPHALPSQFNGFILHKNSPCFWGVATIAASCSHVA